MQSVFVTVGSTSFDDLIKTMCSEPCIDLLKTNGYSKIVLQIGRGDFEPPVSSDLEIEWFRYKDSITDNIKKASLVIGHAGAGTILESLFECKPLIVVLNEKLMDNHQGELAEKLASEGYLKYTSCSNLLETLEKSIASDFVETSFTCQEDVDTFAGILEFLLEIK